MIGAHRTRIRHYQPIRLYSDHGFHDSRFWIRIEISIEITITIVIFIAIENRSRSISRLLKLLLSNHQLFGTRLSRTVEVEPYSSPSLRVRWGTGFAFLVFSHHPPSLKNSTKGTGGFLAEPVPSETLLRFRRVWLSQRLRDSVAASPPPPLFTGLGRSIPWKFHSHRLPCPQTEASCALSRGSR